ncbi:unnamed protein product, partial [Laminaria digitata]
FVFAFPFYFTLIAFAARRARTSTPPLTVFVGCNSILQTTSTMPMLTSTFGRSGGDLMVSTVGGMARGSSGASDMEKGIPGRSVHAG